MPTVRYSSCTYACAISPETRRIIVSRTDRGGHLKSEYVVDEAGAHAWLGNHGLRRGKIKKLLSEVFPKG